MPNLILEILNHDEIFADSVSEKNSESFILTHS